MPFNWAAFFFAPSFPFSFSRGSFFCAQAEEVHCVGRHPEKRGELGAAVCPALKPLKGPE